MKTRRPLSSAVLLLLMGGAVGGVLLAATPAYAQATATSTFTVQASGTVGTPQTAAASVAAGPEAVSCSGPVKLTTTAVTDPILPPGVVVSIDARGLSCIGQTTNATYVNTGQANLTRLLVPNDVIKTTFAFYQDVPGGFLNARTALLTLNLSYDTTTGALTSASGSVSNFQ